MIEYRAHIECDGYKNKTTKYFNFWISLPNQQSLKITEELKALAHFAQKTLAPSTNPGKIIVEEFDVPTIPEGTKLNNYNNVVKYAPKFTGKREVYQVKPEPIPKLN